MSMKLVIVESPSKAKTISKYLGSDFRVLASVGHVRDLPKSNKKAIDIEAGFVPHYEVVPKKEAVIAEIRHAAAGADEVLIATDPDREGEAIAWHLKELLTDKKIGGAVSPKKIERITYHEVTKEAVEEALKNPRAIDEHLREAQEARRVLDRLVGYDLSGLIWKKVRYGLSAGRVQSPALRIIMEREHEIRAFIPESYWSIVGQFKTEIKSRGSDAPSSILELSCVEEPRDEKEVERILAIARAKKWRVIDIEETEQKRSPKAPFITSTLQQTASSRLGFSPSRTMGIAQKLYEAGHITYMRTDSTSLGQQALAQIAATVEKQYGAEYLQFRTYSAKSMNAQEAHEAIRPSKMSALAAGTNEEQKKLYRLIWQRTIASQMIDARIARTKIIGNIDAIEAATDDRKKAQTEHASIPDFTANGSRIIAEGWLKADPESRGEEVQLPACAKGERLDLISIDAIGKQTEPPARYTEAGLIKELEKRGIGRPSTYASITRTIEERGYVEKEGRSLKPTDTGDVVSSFLEEYFPTYISDTFTAEMENELDEIANGERTYIKTLSDFYGPFIKEVRLKDKLAKATNLGKADARFVCPKCGSQMDIKLGRMGKFLSCSRYPDCEGALMLDGTEIKKGEPIGIDPASGLPIFVLNGRFGPYVQLGAQTPKVKKAKKPKAPKATKSKKTRAGETPDPIIANDAILDAKAAAPIKPRMASIPKGVDLGSITVADAMRFLSVPRKLGDHPITGKTVTASIGRFGPYVVHDGNYRSIKAPLNVYDITLEQALELLAKEKKPRGFAKKKKE
jgi:DNA topoisomerase I